MSGPFGTDAEVSYGHFGTSADISWVRNVLGPKCAYTEMTVSRYFRPMTLRPKDISALVLKCLTGQQGRHFGTR